MYRRQQPPANPVFLSVVIPVYRSESCLDALASELRAVLDASGWTWEVVLVNDYSPDTSWRVIERLCDQDRHFVGVDLRRNFGQDNAILTGLRLARGTCVAVMDDDLQHHPRDLPRLIAHLTDDVDVVYADFQTKHQAPWKNAGSWLNGKIADWVLYKPRHVYLSPYKVIRREVVDLVRRYPGPTPYIDGLLFQNTWRIASVPVQHHPRYSGESNYDFWRAAGLSARLVFSFSTKPARFILLVGAALSAGAFTGMLALLVFDLVATEWWSSNLFLNFCMFLIGGLQMMSVGLIGEYAGRIYMRVNRKPQTSIRRITGRNDEEELVREVTIEFDADL